MLYLLPATAPEIAAELGISVRLANARLQYYGSRGLAVRTDRAVKPLEKTRGRWPHIWERTVMGGDRLWAIKSQQGDSLDTI